MRKSVWCAVAVAVVGLIVWFVFPSRPSADSDGAAPTGVLPSGEETNRRAAAPKKIATVEPTVSDEKAEVSGASESEAPKTEEEKKAEAEEAAVEAFDNLTDKWMEPNEKGASMADVNAFVAQFAKVPADRKEECLQRALNLVPDENVMLLAGVLMDKSQPKELVELVFNDILNRDEDVKKPILQQIYKDKTHACWADTAWILDVTGEKPAK